jgi:hypothetical protein
VIRPSGQFAGRLRYDTFVNGRTCILPTWLIATSDRHVAARVVIPLGGRLHAEEHGDDQEFTCGVLTNDAAIDILLDGPQAIRLRMLRRHGSTVLLSWSGRTQQISLGTQPCQCPPTLKGRWQAAKAGHGCEPLIQVAFRLAADPTLGRFLLSSATWAFADHATTVKGGTASTAWAGARSAGDRPRAAHHRQRHDLAYTRPTIRILPTP